LDGEGGSRHLLLRRSNFFWHMFLHKFFPLSWLGLVVGIIVCICKKRGWAGCKNFIVTRYWAKNLLFSAHGMRVIFSKYFVKNQYFTQKFTCIQTKSSIEFFEFDFFLFLLLLYKNWALVYSIIIIIYRKCTKMRHNIGELHRY